MKILFNLNKTIIVMKKKDWKMLYVIIRYVITFILGLISPELADGVGDALNFVGLV